MLDFNTVRMRGAARVALAASDAMSAPPHSYVVEPLVHQLVGPDYNADNGALLTPHEAQNLAMMIGQMAASMDTLEQAKAAVEARLEHLEHVYVQSEAEDEQRRRKRNFYLLWAAATLMWASAIFVGIAF